MIYKIIAGVTTILFSLIGWQTLLMDSHYKWDYLGLVPLVWLAYVARDRLRLHPAHYALFCAFLTGHFLGAFGAYSLSYNGIYYDVFVHAFGGFIGTLIAFRALTHLDGWQRYALAITIIMAFGAMHEIMEFLAGTMLGSGDGAFFVGAGDLNNWDTQKDLFSNFIGALIALTAYRVRRMHTCERTAKQTIEKTTKRTKPRA